MEAWAAYCEPRAAGTVIELSKQTRPRGLALRRSPARSAADIRLQSPTALGRYRAGENPAAWRGHLENLLPKQSKLSRGIALTSRFKEISQPVAA